MRTLKFRRAYFDYKDDSFAGFSLWGSDYDENGIPTGFIAPSSWSYAKGKVDQQFTGLKDKNGNPIYEGDVVIISYGKAIVKYIDECGAFMLQWIDDKEANMELVAFSNNGYKLGRSRAWEKDIPEVIGNIYSNPEL